MVDYQCKVSKFRDPVDAKRTLLVGSISRAPDSGVGRDDQARREAGFRLLNDAAADLLEKNVSMDLVERLFSRFATHLGCELMLHYRVLAERMTLVAAVGLNGEARQQIATIGVGQYLCGLVAETGCLLHVPKDELWRFVDRIPALASGMKCYACAPLVTNRGVIGTVSFGSAHRDGFSSDDLELIQALARFVAAAEARAATEAALRESEERFRHFVDRSTDGLFLLDEHGLIWDVNSQACHALGYPREELLGRPFNSLGPLDQRDPAPLQCQSADSAEVVSFDTTHERKDGALIEVEVRARPYWVGRTRNCLALVRDITERKRAERVLQERESSLRRAQEMARVGNWSFDLKTRSVRGSPECMRIAGVSEGRFTEADLYALVHPEDREAMKSKFLAALQGAAYQHDHRIQVRGETRWVSAWAEPEFGPDGKVRRVSGVIQDITERRRLEAELRQAQKMEALGRLAGGVAHDFNNLLTVIVGFGEDLKSILAEKGLPTSEIETILDSSEKAAELTKHLLAFSRMQGWKPTLVDLERVVRGLEPMLRRIVHEDILISITRLRRTQRVRIDLSQAEQMIVNLVANARDAMPRGGKINISIDQVAMDAVSAAEIGLDETKEYVVLTVKDDGEGMSPEVRSRMFEPFFTTKGVGKGTGLGMAMVYGTIVQSGGCVGVDSEIGKGTSVRLYLPAVGDVELPVQKPVEASPSRGTESVLVVEDDESVRHIVEITLKKSGYSVLLASSGSEALRLLSETPSLACDLVLTDVVMPGMGGRELVDAIRAKRPALRALFMTGHADEAVLQHGVQIPHEIVLSKPFLRSELIRKVRATLDGPAQREASEG